MLILAIIGLAAIFSSIIAKAISGFPFLSFIPVLNDIVPWLAGPFVLPAGLALFMFGSTRNVVWSVAAFFISLAVTMFVFHW